jgi:hypothetical protein
LLLHESSIRRAGLPRADLFWWAEDTEYIRWRLQRGHGFTPIVHRESVVRHLHPTRHRIKPAWKYYYEIRNEIYVSVSFKKANRFWRIPKNVARQIVRILFWDRQGVVTKLRIVGLGIRHGLSGRLGKLLDPERP